MYEAPKVNLVKDNLIRVHNPMSISPQTQLTTNLAAGYSTLAVRNNAGFSNGDFILFEGYGNENAEIKRINAAITAGTVLACTAPTFAHSIDCSVEKVLWDQVKIYGTNTTIAVGTLIATVDLQVDSLYTDYVVTGTTYTYYYVTFYNSAGAVEGEESDLLLATDFLPNTVGFVRRAAFENIDQDFAGKYSHNWVFDQLYQCELDVLKSKDKWGSMVELEYDMGNITRNLCSMALPTDIEDKQTNKSILGLRIAGRDNMEWVDNDSFHDIMYDVHHTTLATTAAVGAVTLVLTDSRDFDDSGSVMIAGTDYTYTGNTRSTNTLTGLTALSAQIDSGADVWQGIDEGEPRRYTVRDGYAYFDVPTDSDWTGRNIWIDYYKTAQRYDSDSDTLLMNDPGLYILWLEIAIKKRRSGGDLPQNDNSWKEYERRKALLTLKDKNPYDLRMVPLMPDIRNRKQFGWWR